ncbi:uncharacterized protein N7459_001855 [Penicillium hispanicum]|uniref:uncharacterized protein n=1 Tax=Penicillium hispanicum TaxID=1080232 RepID=UPI002541EB6E|nr:uncharacterized protein N7459_001855 [Penicillium hispanicum]KAJ5591486.1 hypothetical protein N7459_001855 [Penicillium hispanicum]
MSFLLAGLSLLAAAQAASVSPVAVKGGCASLPQYNAQDGIAGPWVVTVDQCVNTTAADHACSMEGFGSTSVYLIQSGETSPHRGYIGIVSENDLAKSPIRCNDASKAFESYVQYEYDVKWLGVNVTDMPYSAELMYGLGQYSLPIQAYNHYKDGVKQDGLFLGAHNVTTWGIQPVEGDQASGGKPWWMIRLLGPNSAVPNTGKPLYDGEFRTFIRIDGS